MFRLFSTSNKTIINTQQHPFHIVQPSPWPFLVAFSICLSIIATVLWLHGYSLQNCFFLKVLPFGFFFFFFALICWFLDIITEATLRGQHTRAVQKGLKLGFILFIVSEIMFFFGFFWAFFHSSVSPTIWIGAVWPPLGIKPINPYALPLINTVILLSSGVTITWGHKVIVAQQQITSTEVGGYNARQELTKAIFATISLGIIFTFIQLYEYQHASFSINDSIYGSVFYLLTGFHGFHVLVGTIFLCVCLFRHLAYHFTRDHHLGLEMAIWYWHFVDIVWIFLFIFVYIWGS